jgi:hypothetical protein
MRLILVALASLWLVGCGDTGPSDYRTQLDELTTVSLLHGADATSIAAHVFDGADPSVFHVAWAVDPLPPAPSGELIDGVDVDCSIWVEWWGSQWLSGASADGPAISYTSLGHEMAHCVLDMAGTPDPNHTRPDWWGSGGKVDQAMAALAAAGL